MNKPHDDGNYTEEEMFGKYKPREFWIDVNNNAHDDEASAECADPEFLDEIIHVIEKSAFDELKRELLAARTLDAMLGTNEETVVAMDEANKWREAAMKFETILFKINHYAGPFIGVTEIFEEFAQTKKELE